ncbi:hypothetical protein BUALT_Bualt07G0004600 [Buddleja alternifolia]|uniref:BTB domain-containing protein n=1 Tax=Buddleja alternifolia TaxID=168488 RepID=A0AAV6XDV2_9LAMI|nr:hypothetical protein BUALT_Bualt07G0004600 [Buddleja alternifolia]
MYTDKLPEDDESPVCGYAFGPSVSSILVAKLHAATHEYDLRRSFAYLEKNYLFLFNELKDYVSNGNRLYSAKETQLFPDTSQLRPISKLQEMTNEASESTSQISESSSPVRFLFEIYSLDQSSKGNHHGHSKSTLPNGSLVSFMVTRLDIVISSNIQDLPVIEVPVSTMVIDFRNLLESKEEADVFFKVANESFCAHKYILATRSPLFCSHFSDYHQDQEMVIPDIEPKVFKGAGNPYPKRNDMPLNQSTMMALKSIVSDRSLQWLPQEELQYPSIEHWLG